jgi:two-component system cell cycle response regulator DivK
MGKPEDADTETEKVEPDRTMPASARSQTPTEESPTVPMKLSERETCDLPALALPKEDRRPLVLCIDGDPDNLGLVEGVLATTNRYRLSCVSDGIRGLELARKEHPSLVLMDIDLPLVDGFEIYRRMRDNSETAQIPVVAVTASVMKGERRRCMELGFDAFVEKPFDIHELRQLVTRLTSVDSRASSDGPATTSGNEDKA